MAWRHDILRRGLVVWVPLRRHLLHVWRIAVGGRIVLGMVVLRIGVVVHRRVCLGRHVVVVVLVVLPASLVHGTSRLAAMRAGHHGRRQAQLLPLQLGVGSARPDSQRARQRGVRR